MTEGNGAGFKPPMMGVSTEIPSTIKTLGVPDADFGNAQVVQAAQEQAMSAAAQMKAGMETTPNPITAPAATPEAAPAALFVAPQMGPSVEAPTMATTPAIENALQVARDQATQIKPLDANVAVPPQPTETETK